MRGGWFVIGVLAAVAWLHHDVPDEAWFATAGRQADARIENIQSHKSVLQKQNRPDAADLGAQLATLRAACMDAAEVYNRRHASAVFVGLTPAPLKPEDCA